MVACSVPILNAQQEIVACLYTHAPTIRKSLQDLMVYKPVLREAAQELSQLIQQG